MELIIQMGEDEGEPVDVTPEQDGRVQLSEGLAIDLGPSDEGRAD